jgi:hypothetical protein
VVIDKKITPDGLVLFPLGETKVINPKNELHFTQDEISELIGGQITIIPLANEEKPRRRRRIMCINLEGEEMNLQFNFKAKSIFDVSCWGIAVILNVRDMGMFF